MIRLSELIHKDTQINNYRLTTFAALLLLSINPVWTEGKDCINLLLCGALCVSPLVLILRETRVFIPRIDIPLSLVCFFVIVFPIIFHPETLRWTTMLFTCAYCVFFMMYARTLRTSGIGSESFGKFVKYIVYAYAIVLIIQQLAVLSGLPIPLKSQIYVPEVPFKLNSLSAEPSHTSVMLSMLMYFYAQSSCYSSNSQRNLLRELRQNPLVWIAFAWVIFTTLNLTAFIFGPLCLLPYLNNKNLPVIACILVVLTVIISVSPFSNSNQFERLRNVVSSSVTLDEKNIMSSDISASSRIVPSIRGAALIDFSDPKFITGHGVDADKRDTAPQPDNRYGEGSAGIFGMWHNYGALCAICFWVFMYLVSVVRRYWISGVTFIILLLLSAEYNMQLIWQVLALSLMFKYSIVHDKKILQPCERRRE